MYRKWNEVDRIKGDRNTKKRGGEKKTAETQYRQRFSFCKKSALTRDTESTGAFLYDTGEILSDEISCGFKFSFLSVKINPYPANVDNMASSY